MRRDTRAERGLYRARDGAVLGVCKGIARHFDFSVFWVRVGTAAACLITGLWPGVLLYILAALLMKPEPIIPFESEEDQEFYNSYTSSRSMALHRLKKTFDSLDRRIRRIEDLVTDREYEWEKRLNG